MNKRDTAHSGRSRRERGSVLRATPRKMHRLVLRGELGHDSAVALEAAIDDLCASGVEHIVLDLSALSAIDRTGVGVVAMRRQLCRRHGVTLEVVGASPDVTAAFEAAGLIDQVRLRENRCGRSVS